jgi:hypothetical protein
LAINLLLIGLQWPVSTPVWQKLRTWHGMFCFVAYYNMVNVGQNQLAAGKRTSLPLSMR